MSKLKEKAEINFQLIKRHFEQHGNPPPTNTNEGAYFYRIASMHKSGNLDLSTKLKYQAIPNFRWHKESIFEKNIKDLLKHLDNYGSYPIAGTKLGSFVSKARSDFKSNKLTPEQIEKLININFKFNNMKEVIFLKTSAEVKNFIKKNRYSKKNWRWVGDQKNNEIHWNRNQFSHSAIIEVVTNGMDAFKQREALKLDKSVLQNMEGVRDFTEECFGYRHLDRSNERSLRKIADNVQVWVEDSEHSNKPTISVRDKGIGIKGEDFKDTICSFGNSNKEHNKFLIGRYGIGGSTTLSFCEYRIIVSRPINSSQAYFTIQEQVYEKHEDGKEELGYKYLVDSETQEPFSFTVTDEEFECGTLVKQVQYEMTGRTGSPRQYENNSIRRVFETGLFDPAIPFYLYGYRKTDWDKTTRDSGTDRTSKDAYGRICHKSIMMGNKSMLEAQYNRNEIVDYSHKVRKSLDTEWGKLEFDFSYYVLDDKREKFKKDYYFPTETRNVIHVRDGQMHGYSLGYHVFRDLKFEHSFIKSDMLFVIDYTDLNKKLSSLLLMPNREQVREDIPLYKDIVKVIQNTLTVDRELRVINERRKEEALKNIEEDKDLLERLKNLLKISEIKTGKKDLEEMLEPIEMKEVPTYIQILTDKNRKFKVGEKVKLLFATDGPVGVDDFINGYSDFEGYDFEKISQFTNGYGIAVFKPNQESNNPITFSIGLNLKWPGSKINLRDTYVVNLIKPQASNKNGQHQSKSGANSGNSDPRWLIVQKDQSTYEKFFPIDQDYVTGFYDSGTCYLNGENKYLRNLLLKCTKETEREEARSNYIYKTVPLLIEGINDFKKKKSYLNGVDPINLQRDFTYHISKSAAGQIIEEMSL